MVNRRTQNRDRLPGRRRLNNRPLGDPLTRQRAIRFQGGIIRRCLGQIRWSLPTGRRQRNPPEERTDDSTSSGYTSWKVIPRDASDRVKICGLKRPPGGTTRPMRLTSGLGAKRWADRL